MEGQAKPFFSKYRRTLIIAAVPAWVIFIILAYLKTRPHNATGSASHVLEVGALPVT